MPKTYKLVIVGRPNDGKSSIFANFLGDDEVAVSPIPGETKRMQPRRINLGECDIEVVDTPGLQHPETVYLKFIEYSKSGRPPAAAFAEDFSDPRYAHDTEIMKALAGADICMLVVNADNYFGHTQKCLLDTFSMLSPSSAVVGVINRKDEQFLGEWRSEFESRGMDCFDFDAFRSRFRDCARLFDEICSSPTLRRRSDLCGVLRALKENRSALWESNLDSAASEILNSLKDLMLLHSSLRLSEFSLTPEERRELRADLSSGISAFVRRFRADTLRRFRYSGIKLKSSEFRAGEDELKIKSPNFVFRVFGSLPFFRRPEASCFVDPRSDLPARFVRGAVGFVSSLVSFSYAQSATKEFEMDAESGAPAAFDSEMLPGFIKRAAAGDDSDSFFELQSRLRTELFSALKSLSK